MTFTKAKSLFLKDKTRGDQNCSVKVSLGRVFWPSERNIDLGIAMLWPPCGFPLFTYNMKLNVAFNASKSSFHHL